MAYKPAPRDTSSAVLPHAIEALRQPLARNTDENRARRRTAEGRRYGPLRDHARKEHPNLVPYGRTRSGFCP